jgi:hypothetical protein
MRTLLHRPLTRLGLGLIAVAIAVEPFLIKAGGGRVTAWAHWWCSPSVASRGGSSGASGDRAVALLLAPMRVLAVHWPHFLPLLVGLATLVYLRRANARYHESSPWEDPFQGLYSGLRQ